MNKMVVFYARVLTHYRIRFHELVRENLAQRGVEYRLLYSRGRQDELSKNDFSEIEWAQEVPVSYFGPREKLCWQSGNKIAEASDLVILGQENALLHNYPLIIKRSLFRRQKVAFFGHGRNFQSRGRRGLAEAFKSFWLTKVDWWFAYTQGCADGIVSTGFRADRVTVFNNSIDMNSIRRDIAVIKKASAKVIISEDIREDSCVAVYVGGMYAEKRLEFLIEAAKIVKGKVPKFELILIGSGPMAHIARDADVAYPWVSYVGAKFGIEKSELVNRAQVILMPGLVGLAVLDSFAYGKPIVTTNIDYHSPEIEYLISGYNGVIVPNAGNVQEYADAVIGLFENRGRLSQLKVGAEDSANKYSIENMASLFSDGVIGALG